MLRLRHLTAAFACAGGIFTLGLSLSSPAAEAAAAGPIVGPEEVRSTISSFFVAPLPRAVRIRVQPCPGDPTAQGCHSASARMDTVWLNPQAGGLDSETVAHEMGHVFESYMWDLRWRRERGSAFVPRTFFRIAEILFDEPRPGILYSVAWSERFAEAYSACARFETLTETLYTGYYGFEMTPSQHDRVCVLIDRMAGRYAAEGERSGPNGIAAATAVG